MAAKQRVDALLVAQGLVDSREQAKRLILAGEVMCGTDRVAKASQKFPEDAPLSVKDKPKFVGRGVAAFQRPCWVRPPRASGVFTEFPPPVRVTR